VGQILDTFKVLGHASIKTTIYTMFQKYRWISSPLDRLVDENNKKNLKISRKHSKDVYI
jgi:hypothetical protein